MGEALQSLSLKSHPVLVVRKQSSHKPSRSNTLIALKERNRLHVEGLRKKIHQGHCLHGIPIL